MSQALCPHSGSIAHDARTVGRRLSLLLILLGASGCSDPVPRPMDELVREGSVYLHPVTLEPYSGPVFTTFSDAPLQVEQRASLREGHYDGPFEWYFDNRQLSLRETYREGLKDGPYEWYLESGRLYERGTYRDGALDGPYEAYYETGDLYERGSYRDGDFHGAREWYVDDQLIELVTYAYGSISGRYERYTLEGELDLAGILLDGQPCGVWTEGGVRIAYPPCYAETD